MTLPKRLQSSLWSYDLSSLKTKRDAGLIIRQVLNYGEPEDIKWLFKTYSPEDIKSVLIHPARGMWFRPKLRQWLAYFNFIIDPLEFEAAVMDLNPRPILTKTVFQRRGII